MGLSFSRSAAEYSIAKHVADVICKVLQYEMWTSVGVCASKPREFFVSHVQVELFTRNVSYIGSISILLTKNWRIYRIFYNHNMRIDVSQ